MFLLVPAYLGSPGQTTVVVVVVNTLSVFMDMKLVQCIVLLFCIFTAVILK